MIDDAEIYHLTVDAVRTRASTNEAIVSFAVPLEKAALISGFMSRIGHQVGAAFVDLEPQNTHPEQASRDSGSVAAPAPGGETSHRGRYGELAKELRLSGFFRRPEVWMAVGTDKDFLDWCRKQTCVVCGDGDYDEQTGELRNQPAHVRRVANGSGTGIKPEYSAVPMCSHDHNQVQHQHGETKAYRRHLMIKTGHERQVTLDEAQYWFDKQRIDAVQAWCWAKLKTVLGYSTWKEVPPDRLRMWCRGHGIKTIWLPEGYRE